MKAKTLLVFSLFLICVNYLYGQTSGNYVLENDSLKTTISIPSMQINAYYKVNGQSYTTQALSGYTVTSINSSVRNKLVVNTTTFNITFSLSGNSVDMVLDGDPGMSISEVQFPGHIQSKSDDYMIVPRSAGVIWPVTKDYPFYSLAPFSTKSSMSFVGVTNLKTGYMLVTDDPWDVSFRLVKTGTETLVNPKFVHYAAKGKLGYKRSFHLVFVNNGYVEMAQWYRKNTNKLGWSKTFAEKAAVNPNIERLKGAVDFQSFNMGNNISVYDKLKSFGLDKAVYYLHSSYQYGLINSLNQRGYLTTTYDNFFDVYPPEAGYGRSEGYPGDVLVKSDGTLQKGWVHYINGNPVQGYYLCPETHAEYARKTIPSRISANPLNSLYADVEFSYTLTECFSSTHPLTRKRDGLSRVELMNVIKNENSLVASTEEGHDFGYSVMDYTAGSMAIVGLGGTGYFSIIESPKTEHYTYDVNPAVRLPLLGLAYHDAHMPTWGTTDGVSKVPNSWDDADLFNILYATMPTFTPASLTHWDSNLDRFMTSYHLTSSITRNVGFDEMTNHAFLTSDWKVQQTEFSSGWKVTANFNTTSYQYGNKLLAPKGFYAADDAQNEVFKIVDSGSNLAAAFTGDRLYINPYGIEHSYKGVKTAGSVFLRKDASSVHLAFIGSQTSIKINPSLMPWFTKRAYSVATGKEIAMTNIGSGWYQINRPSGENFIRLEVDITMSQEEILEDDIKVGQFNCYPNPVQEVLYVDMDLPTSQDVSISLFEITGKAVRVLLNSKALPGINNFQFNMDDIASGAYILSVKTDEKTVNKKIVVL